MKTVTWAPEPKGPGRNAVHMFIDTDAGRVELLAYDLPADGHFVQLYGFEIYGRRRERGPFHEQLASGDATSLEEAKAKALAMAAQPKATWTKLPPPAVA